MRALFETRSIAVIGASTKEEKVGHVILRNLIRSGFSGDLYPVNPGADYILGLKAYPDLVSIPGPVELAVVVVPNIAVPRVMEQAGTKGVKAAVIISAGFRETGKEGAELEKRVGEIASRHGIRVLGPNCLGIISTPNKMNATFTDDYPSMGGVAITSQSGAMGTIVLDWAKSTRVGFSHFISVGNKLDIDEVDLLEYLREDEQTTVIGMYVEGLDRGRKFIEQASATSRYKPILALKAGRTDTGAKAASSHTGALSGSDKIYDAALAQAGVIRVMTIDEFFDLLQAFANMPLPKGDGVGIITNAGGLGVMAADACSDHGLGMATLARETVARLKTRLPEESNFYNPVDVIGDADATRYEFAARTVMEDPNVNCVLAMIAPSDLLDISAVARAIVSLARQADMPVVTAFVGGTDVAAGANILLEAGIPNYVSPDRAVRALAAMVRYQETRGLIDGGDVPLITGDRAVVRELLDRVRSEGRTSLSEGEGKQVLRAYGVNVPSSGLARTASEAVELARSIGFPVVLKVSSPDIAHKTDVGGVIVNLQNEGEVRRNFELMMSRMRTRLSLAHVDGATVEKMFSGREVIVGMVRDEQFGPIITFGLGGIFVEVLKDVAQTIAPLTPRRVDELIRSIRGYPILAGARGRKPADMPALKEVIFRVAQLAMDFPEFTEFEINPVMVGDEGQGCGAVDALATIRREMS